jgi:hypothetical protein
MVSSNRRRSSHYLCCSHFDTSDVADLAAPSTRRCCNGGAIPEEIRDGSTIREVTMRIRKAVLRHWPRGTQFPRFCPSYRSMPTLRSRSCSRCPRRGSAGATAAPRIVKRNAAGSSARPRWFAGTSGVRAAPRSREHRSIRTCHWSEIVLRGRWVGPAACRGDRRLDECVMASRMSRRAQRSDLPSRRWLELDTSASELFGPSVRTIACRSRRGGVPS